MSVLLKFILISIVIFYVLRKVMGFFFRIMAGNQPPPQNQRPPKREGEINIDYNPQHSDKKFGDDFKGGEYIDYEEVK